MPQEFLGRLPNDVAKVAGELQLSSSLSDEWLHKVATTRDTELRCHRVALTYSKYAAFLDTWLLGPKSYWSCQLDGKKVTECNANWFHFSTWAALTVSRNIGSIAAPQRFDGWPNTLRQLIAPYVVRARGADHQKIGQALSSAQLKIFMNTCVAFVDFIEWSMEERLEGKPLTPKDPVRGWMAGDKTMYELALRGFLFYQQAKVAIESSDTTSFERYILLGNLMSTVVEQHLIDRELSAVIDAVPSRLAETTEGRIGQLAERLMGVPRQVTEFALASRLAPARAAATDIWGRLLTSQVFVMSLPGEMLRLGKDIPPLQRNDPYYPTHLRGVSDLNANEDMRFLRDLIVRFDRTTGDGRGSKARDWRRYDERMNWALTLLRTRQQDTTMFWPPYSQEDEQRITDGRLPRRSGDATQIIAPLDNELVAASVTGVMP